MPRFRRTARDPFRHLASDEAADWSGADPAAEGVVDVVPSATNATDFSGSRPIAGCDGDDVDRRSTPDPAT